MKRVIAGLAAALSLALTGPLALAGNPFGGIIPIGSGTSAACTGVGSLALGSTGSSPTLAIGGTTNCLYVASSNNATDIFSTVTLTLPATHTDGTTAFRFTTQRAISTLKFSAPDAYPVTVNGQVTSTLGAFAAGQSVDVAYLGGKALIWSSGTGTGTSAGGGSTTFTPQTSLLPYINASMDADLPASTAALTAGTPGIQLDSSNNVLALNAPVQTGGGTVNIVHGYGELSLGSTNGPGGHSYFIGNSQSYNNGYDGFVMPQNWGDPLYAAANSPWVTIFVMKQTGTGASNFIAANTNGVQMNFQGLGGATDGAFYINQNNGPIQGNETAGSLSALNQWQIVTVVSDGTKFQVWRNNTRVISTPTGDAGDYGPGALVKMEYLNNPQAQVALVETAPGAPSNTQLTQEIQRLATRYGISGVGSITDGPTTQIPPSSVPSAATVFNNYITSVNYPTAADPVDSTAKPQGWNTADKANLTNVASFVFGSGTTNAFGQTPNITNRAQLESHFEFNQVNGTAGQNLSNDGAKQSNSAAFNAEFRTYPDGDIHDTHTVNSGGLQLKAYCAGSGGTVCQGQANIVTGIIRPETSIVPGEIVETCMQRPGTGSPGAWLTTWLTGGRYPAPSATPPTFYGAAGNPPWHPTYYVENDFPDGFAINDGTPNNHDLTPGTPTLNDSANTTRQMYSPLYLANGGGFSQATGSATYMRTTTDLSTSVHCYQTEIVPTVYSDTARTVVQTPGKVNFLLDGVLYETIQYNWLTGPELDWNSQPLAGNPVAGSSLMVALQYGAYFNQNDYNAMTPQNVSAAFANVASIRVWKRATGTTPPPATYPNSLASTTLAMTSPVYDSTNPQCGTAALSGGYGLTPNAFTFSGTSWTAGIWVRTTASGSEMVAMGTGGAFLLGMQSTGKAEAIVGNQGILFTSPTSINDGAWHYLELDVGTASTTFYVDGAVGYTSAQTPAAMGVTFGTYSMGVGSMGGDQSRNWNGAVDEAVFYSGTQHTAAFSPSTTQLTGTEPNQVFLYKLDGNGNNSTAGAVP